MKKIHLRKLSLFLFLSLLVFSFSSCESDDYTKTGKLTVDTYDWRYQPETNGYGVGTVNFDIDIRDINGYYVNDPLYRIDLYNSFLTIDSQFMGTGDVVEIRLWSSGVREYIGVYNTDNRGYTGISSEYDRAYGDFMQALMDKLYTEGYLQLRVTIKVNRYQYIPYHVEITNNLDLIMRN